MTQEEIQRENFEQALELPPDAVDYLLALWNVIQVLDDACDGDEVIPEDVHRAAWDCLAGMPTNTFFQAHKQWLVPALAQMVMKWAASDMAERNGTADPRSYMWRAGYYDVVAMVAGLVHGQSSPKVWKALALYGETVEEYMKEFRDA